MGFIYKIEADLNNQIRQSADRFNFKDYAFVHCNKTIESL
jgi:hypothetical protein